MKIQLLNLNAFNLSKMQKPFQNVSKKIIRIKDQAIENFQNVDLKYILDVLKQPKIFAATVISAGFGGMALYSQTQNTPVATSSNYLTNFSAAQNTSNLIPVNSSSTLELLDETFSTGKIVLSVLGLIAVVAGSIFVCNEYECGRNSESVPPTPGPIKLSVLHKALPTNEKFVRISQIRALSKLFNGFEWNSSFQANENVQLINSTLEPFQNIKFGDLENLSDDDFKVWEENFIKLITLICYEKNQVRNSYEMNETFLQFIKRLYKDFLEIEFEGTDYAGSTRKKIIQELLEQKISYDGLDFKFNVPLVNLSQNDLQSISIKVEILTAMLYSEALARETVRSLLRPPNNNYHDQYLTFQQIEKEIRDLESEMSDSDLSKFPDIERRSLELLSDLNCAKQFNLNHYSREEWRKQDFASVEKLYRENLEIFLNSNLSTLPSSLETQKRFSEFSALREYFYAFYSKSIYLSLKSNPSYFQQHERLEDLKSKVNNYVYVLHLSAEELYQLKVDLIKQHLSLNLKTGLFAETIIKESEVSEILTELDTSAIEHQNSLFPLKPEIENVSSSNTSFSENSCSRHCLSENKSGASENLPPYESKNPPLASEYQQIENPPLLNNKYLDLQNLVLGLVLKL